MRLLLAILVAGLAGSSLGAVIVFDHTTGSSFPVPQTMYESFTPNNRIGKQFTVSQQVGLTSFQIWCQGVVSLPANATMEVRGDTGGSPGTLIASTSGVVPTTTGSGQIAFNFVGAPTLSVSTTYWAVFYATSASDDVMWLHSASSTADGNRSTTNAGTNWNAATGNDLRRLSLIVNGNVTGATISSSTRAGVNPTNAASVSFTVTFSAAITGGATTNFSLNATGVASPSISSVTGSGTTRTVTVNTGTGSGTIRLDMANSVGITPNVTNLPYTAGETYTIDKQAPTVSSINRVSASPTNAVSVQWTVTFSEAVTGGASNNFAVTTTGTITGILFSSITGSGTTRTVTYNTGTNDGTMRLDLTLNLGNITDAAGNALATFFNSGQVYAIDKTAPTVQSINRVNPDPTTAASVQYTVTFNESVTGAVTANFSLATTGAVSGAGITGVTGSGATRTVTVSTGTGDGTIRLDLLTLAPAITDTAGNNLSAAFISGQLYTVDRNPPVVVIGAPSVPTTSGADVTFTLTYTDAASISLAPADISLNTTGTATGTAAVGGSGLITRTVTITSISGNGTIGINVAAGTALDGASNPCLAAGPSATFSVLGLPQISIGAPSVPLTRVGPVDFIVTYSNATTVTLAAGDVTVNGVGVTGNAAVTGSGVATRTVTISGVSGDGSFTISLAAGTAGNGSGLALAFGPSAAVNVDNTLPLFTPSGNLSLAQGQTINGVNVGSGSDTFSAAAVLVVAATNVPTGLAVANVANVAGTVTADITASNTAAAGALQIQFTVTDEAGNSGTGTFTVDVFVNLAPTIAPIADQTITMNGATAGLVLTIDDADEGPNALTLGAASNNAVLMDDATAYLFGGVGGARTLAISARADNVGFARITVTVTDSLGGSSSASFMLTVTDATDAPSLNSLVDVTILRDQASAGFAFTASDPQGAATLGAVIVTSANPSLILNTDVSINGAAPNFTYVINPQPAQTGTASLTFSISDGTHTFSQPITVTVIDPTPPANEGGSDSNGCQAATGAAWPMLGLMAFIAPALRRRRM